MLGILGKQEAFKEALGGGGGKEKLAVKSLQNIKEDFTFCRIKIGHKIIQKKNAGPFA